LHILAELEDGSDHEKNKTYEAGNHSNDMEPDPTIAKSLPVRRQSKNLPGHDFFDDGNLQIHRDEQSDD
jgi:hypothetical protein